LELILVVNFGGSSLKYRAYSVPRLELMSRGHIERLGSPDAVMRTWGEDGCGSEPRPVAASNLTEALRLLFAALLGPDGTTAGAAQIRVVAHKLAHGGPKYIDASIIDNDVLAALEEFATVVPIHNGASITAIRAVGEVLGPVTQVGVFETGFHASIPEFAAVYGLPYEICAEHGIRKYGFHGASHRYVSEQVPLILGVPVEGLRLVSCHLGSGTSVAAILSGRSVEISSGFTPQSGTMMSTRSGDFDAEALMYLLMRGISSVHELRTILAEKSGLLGISGVSGNLPEVMEEASRGNRRAVLAVDAFSYRIRQAIGMCATALNGVDVIAFTGGIGERSPEIRRRVCSGLEFLGLSLDQERNAFPGKDGVLSAADSRVKVVTLETDEEFIVAREALRIIGETTKSINRR